VTAEERWAALVETILAGGRATYGSDAGPQQAFGSTSLKTEGKIFAMLVKDRLVVKLDRRRVDALVEAGQGERFDPGHGRLMKEWLSVADPASDAAWLDLATEAETFVAKRRQRS
jgi:TfoX/Sxy family transcriptional regulator of competence genes